MLSRPLGLGLLKRTKCARTNRYFSSKKSFNETFGFERKMDSDLRDSVKSIKKHVLICDGPQSWATWPEKIEKMEGLVGQISHYFRKDDDIRVIACDLPNSSLGHYDVVYHDATSRSLWGVRSKTSNYEYLISLIKDEILHPSLSVEPIPPNTSYVLVCSHASRDMRCGYCGPIIADGINEHIKNHSLNKDYVVTKVSHVGGHKYAANVTFYPQGDWYGYICPGDIPKLMDYVDRGDVLEEKWRGNSNQ